MITKEKFNHLSQLDRIEFRQRDEAIRKTYEYGSFSVFVMSMFFIIPITSIMIALVDGRNVMLKFLTNLLHYEVVIWVFAALLLLSDINILLKRKKAYTELINDYFKIEVKKSDRKRKAKR